MTAAAPIEFKRFEKAGRIARFFNAAEKAGYIHQLSWWSKMAPKGAAARDRPIGPGPVSYTHLDVYKRQKPVIVLPKK